MMIPEKVVTNPLRTKKPSIQIVMSYDPESNHQFGLPNRPSTPLKSVIGGSYGNVAEFDQMKRNEVI